MTELNAKDIAKRLGVTETTLNRWCEDGTFPTHTNAPARRDRKWKMADVERFEVEQRLAHTSKACLTWVAKVDPHPAVGRFLERLSVFLVNRRVDQAIRLEWAEMAQVIRGTGTDPTPDQLKKVKEMVGYLDKLEQVPDADLETCINAVCGAYVNHFDRMFRGDVVHKRVMEAVRRGSPEVNDAIGKLATNIYRQLKKKLRDDGAID